MYSARSPHSPEACLWKNQNFMNTILKGPRGIFLWNYFRIWPVVPEEIFKELLKKLHLVAMATRVFNGIKFCEQFSKTTSQGTFLPSFVQTGPAVWEKKMFKEIVDDARRTPDHHKSSPWACCAQVSWKPYNFHQSIFSTMTYISISS